MPSSASDLLRLQKMATGEKVNTWGSELNDTVIELLEDAIAGWENITVTGAVTLTSTNYVADQARKSMINLTGSPSAAFTVTVPGSSKWYWFRNATGQTATITAGGTTCEVYTGEVIGVLTDGTDCYRVERNRFGQALNMGGNKISNLATPTAATDAVTKAYADTITDTAAASATAAANSATAAATSETNAAASASAAATSATNAATSETAAGASATAAGTSETNAAASASAAATSATSAATSQTAAASSASAASTSETNAASSAAAAATSATNAATSETNAASSASAASTSATSAAGSATSAAASFDSFDDRYLGAKAADPVLDNDGDALLTGALYWNTSNNTFRAYNGATWEIFGTGAISLLDEVAEANLSTALQAKVNRSAPNKFDATTAPTATWDSADTAGVGTAFAEGSVVIDTVANEAYRCVDATVSAAIWINTTLTTGELGTIATQNANAVAITGGSISGITDLAIADGGTGASSAAAARSNLGLAIGSDVLAYNAYANTMDQGVATTDTARFATVGVGRLASYALDVSGDIRAIAPALGNAYLRIAADNGGDELLLYQLSGGASYLLNNTNGATTYLRYRDGVGTPVTALSYNSTAVQLFDSSGSAAVYVQGSTGRTGFGTTSPSYTVDVNGSFRAAGVDTHIFGDGTDVISMSGVVPRVAVKGASFASGFVARRDGNAEIGMVATAYGQIGTWTNHRLAFLTNGAEVATFETNGRLGLGETSPSAPLHVKSSSATVILEDTGTDTTSIAYYSLYSSTGEMGRVGYASSSNSDLQLYNGVAGGNIDLIPGSSGGSVQVPATVTRQYAANPRLSVENTSGTSSIITMGSDSGASWVGTTTNTPLDLYVNSSSAVRIDTAGQVGVGVTIPGQALDVDGAIRTQGWGASANNGNIFFGTHANAAQIFGSETIMALYAAGSERVRIGSAGVGIGMTSFGTSAANVIAIGNGTAPTSSPAGGGQLYVESGALKFRGSSGTITTIANA